MANVLRPGEPIPLDVAWDVAMMLVELEKAIPPRKWVPELAHAASHEAFVAMAPF